MPELDWQGVPGEVAAMYRTFVLAANDAAASCDASSRLFWKAGQIAHDANPGAGWLLIKCADADFLAAPAASLAPLVGPRPLTTAIVGGLLGSGLGYGGGYLAEKATGARPGSLRRALAIAGGLAGAAPGALWAGVSAANPDRTGGGVQSVLSPWPFGDGRYANKIAEDMVKASESAGAFYAPTIPVDAFNNVIWSDVHPPNPYGSRSPWGNNEQPLGTPPASAAAISGLLAGAKAATGQERVSPFQVALAAGVAGGQGYFAGAAAARLLSAMAGISPSAQAGLRQAGLWGGIISGVASSLFGR